MQKRFSRTALVIGNDNVEKLASKHVVICGIGGVGSFVAETIARSNVGNITIIDKDIVDETNINRQIIAMTSTIGKTKVEAMKSRIMDINSKCNVNAINRTLTAENIEQYIKGDIDYVVDAIDDLKAKLALILYCKKNSINIISSMGMANKTNPCQIEVTDIYKTIECPVAKIVRKSMKENNIKKLKVVYSKEKPVKNVSKILGSTAYVPSVAGIVITSEVIKDLIK